MVERSHGIEFREHGTGVRHLARICECLPPATFAAACRFLGDSPDPDSAVVMLERLLESGPEGWASTIAGQPSLLHYAIVVFGHSAWLGETLLQNGDLFQRFNGDEKLEHSFSKEEFRQEFSRLCSHSAAHDLAMSLARFRKREYARILLRDTLGIAKLAETTEEISALADALIEEALSAVTEKLRQRYGSPRWVGSEGQVQDSRFSVLSLGKLGGNELNYSSDVDLLFLYDSGIEPTGAAISNREYYILMAQDITELLSRRTREGQVMRIDLRLRPEGHEGELVVPLPRAIQYYSEVAQDWELQAMIKARHSAGDANLAREFVRAVAPYVYRPTVNFAAVKTALQARERIDKRGRHLVSGPSARRTINVKLDRGGIRDIEFLVQCLQRMYGGEERWLRSRGTLSALQKLHDKQHISGKDFHNLNKAYEYLRHLEHQLQLRQGRQSHQLPTDPTELTVLAKRMSRVEAGAPSPDEFESQLQAKMAAVADIYRRIVYQEQSQEFIDAQGNLWLQSQVSASAEYSHSQIMQRLAIDSPQLLTVVVRADLSTHARRNVDRFLSSATTSSERYAAVVRAPRAVESAIAIFECSDYLTNILVRHPADVVLLEGLNQYQAAAQNKLFPTADLRTTEVIDPILSYLAKREIGRAEALSLFRRQFRHALFVANAREVYHPRGVHETLAENSSAADKAIEYALAIADPPAGFAVMALGRLGSGEFDVLSDADLLFVAENSTARKDTSRAAERVVEVLTAYTRDGTLFPVDTRLRPGGREGDLVTTPAQLAQYFARDARAWEAITYLRMRHVAGDPEVAEKTLEVVREGITAVAGRAGFERDLDDMRRRLEESDSHPNLKTGAGGTYDIDYLTGRLQVKHGVWGSCNLSERTNVAGLHGWLAEEDAKELAENAQFLRLLEHNVRLVTGRPGKWIPKAVHARAWVEKLMAPALRESEGPSLDGRVDRVVRRTREIYLKYPF
ncbi:MAG: putative nucleotidyltransferase substrate binding domain-containing protein [Candidatus Korobacteraceae bacterium]